MPEETRPNFVLFITDQQRADFLGCYGHPVLQTPHIDRIAANGVCFDRCYVASPICMPNRASLLTGRMPYLHGVRANGIPLTQRATTIMDLLGDAGYHTALVGKSHMQNHLDNPPLVEIPRRTPGFLDPMAWHSQALDDHRDGPSYNQEKPSFWESPSASVDTPYYGFQHVELTRYHGDMATGNYLHWAAGKGIDIRQLRGRENALPYQTEGPQAWRTAIPEEFYTTSFIAERAEAFIQSTRKPNSPFFLMVSFPDPHHPITPAGRYWDMYDPRDMPVPAAYLQDGWNPPPHVKHLLEERKNGTANINGYAGFAITQAEAQALQALTCGMISHIDDAVGRVMNAVQDAGLTENTVMIFTCDHGDYLGDHGLFLKGPAHYQSLIRTPFIWSDPTSGRPPRRSDLLCSTMDIPAAILDRAHVNPFIGFQGQSPLRALEGSEARDAVVVEEEQTRVCYGFERPARVHTILSGHWRLSIYRGVEWGELYDLKNDPGEFVNLWDAPQFRETRYELMEKLARWYLDNHDQAPFPTGHG